jgi:N-glycosidase YbiA
MRNRYPGVCYRCGERVEVGEGHYERYKGGWRTQHADCAIEYRGIKEGDVKPGSLARPGTVIYTGVIDSFQGEYRFLSNFWPAPIMYMGVEYPSVENAYQASKTQVVEERIPFETCTPAEAKKLGRSVTIRRDWGDKRVSIMLGAVRAKFRRHPDLLKLLLETGDQELIEGNTWGDKFWGVCNGEGENHLGKILMQVREALR